MRHFRFIIVYIVVPLFMWRCAQIMPLTGGARDTKAPVMLAAQPEQKSVNFNSDEIVLSFDEFVQLKNLSNQLIISPKLKSTPEISAEGKKIVVKLKKEELKPNTTYRFSFGRAIADMNESNSIPGFDYVFSTGPYIDTLSIQGLVTDAFTNKPSNDILVGLYPNGPANDSSVFKREADYIARSNENGSFEFKNLPPAAYRVFAFFDKNKNGTYDGETEKVAFYSGALSMKGDTNVRLHLFQELPARTYIKKVNHPYYGFTQLLLNKKTLTELKAVDREMNTRISELGVGQLRDTVSFFYTDVYDSLKITIKAQEWNKADTLKLKLPKQASGSKSRRKTVSSALSSGSLGLGAKIVLSFNAWMDTTRFDASRIKLESKEDSLVAAKAISGKWKAINSFELNTTLKEGKAYSLKLDTAVFYDRKQICSDSALFLFKTQSKADFGKLTVKLLVNKKQNYVLELINEKEEKVRERSFGLPLASSNSVSFDFEDLPPGMYRVRLVFDDNANQKWDTGDVMKEVQPEQVRIHSKQLKVISDWEVEEEISFKD